MNDGEDSFEVRASGDLRNHSAVSGEDVDLGDDDVTENLSVVGDDGSGGFVAGAFNGENIHGLIITYLKAFKRDGMRACFLSESFL